MRTTRWSSYRPDGEERAGLAASVGALLRSLRTERGLTQRALGVRSASSESTVWLLEHGQRRPRPSLLRALAFGLDPDDPDPLAERLIEAVPEASRREDTPAGLRRRQRRMLAARLRVNRLRYALARDAGAARHLSMQLIRVNLRKVEILPRRRSYTPEQEQAELAMLAQLEAILRGSEAARTRSETLFWCVSPRGRHPLDPESLEQAAHRFGVRVTPRRGR